MSPAKSLLQRMDEADDEDEDKDEEEEELGDEDSLKRRMRMME